MHSALIWIAFLSIPLSVFVAMRFVEKRSSEQKPRALLFFLIMLSALVLVFFLFVSGWSTASAKLYPLAVSCLTSTIICGYFTARLDKM